METVSTTYNTLFSVEFLHSGYDFFQQNLIGENVKVRPDKDTSLLFTNHGMNYSFNNGTLVCFMRSRPVAPPGLTPAVPYIAFEGNVRIRFLMHSSPAFLQKTDVISAGSTEVYRFTNQVNAGVNGFIAQHQTGVNDDDLEAIALADPAESCFAVIDIHNNGAVNVSYDLFGAGNLLVSPVYRVRFIPNP